MIRQWSRRLPNREILTILLLAIFVAALILRGPRRVR